MAASLCKAMRSNLRLLPHDLPAPEDQAGGGGEGGGAEEVGRCSSGGGNWVFMFRQSFLQMFIIYECKISPFFLIFLYLFYCLSLNIKIYHLYVNLINQVNENRLNGRQAVRTCKAI